MGVKVTVKVKGNPTTKSVNRATTKKGRHKKVSKAKNIAMSTIVAAGLFGSAIFANNIILNHHELLSQKENFSMFTLAHNKYIEKISESEEISKVENTRDSGNKIADVYIVANYGMDNNGNVKNISANGTKTNEMLEIIKKSNKKSLIMINNFDNLTTKKGQSRWNLASDVTKELLRTEGFTEKFITQAIAICKGANGEKRADGICLDFENVPDEVKEEFTQFICDVKIALDKENLYTTACIPLKTLKSVSSKDNITELNKAYDANELAKTLDAIFVMMYDETNIGSNKPGPVISIKTVEQNLKFFIQNVEEKDLKKIVAVLPGYAGIWSNQKFNSKVAEHKGSRVPVSEINILLSRPRVVYDENGKGSYPKDKEIKIRYDENGDSYITYEKLSDKTGKVLKKTAYFVDDRCMNEILMLVEKSGIGGASLWQMGQIDKNTLKPFERHFSDGFINKLKDGFYDWLNSDKVSSFDR